jgi:hypothetical protein
MPGVRAMGAWGGGEGEGEVVFVADGILGVGFCGGSVRLR